MSEQIIYEIAGCRMEDGCGDHIIAVDPATTTPELWTVYRRLLAENADEWEVEAISDHPTKYEALAAAYFLAGPYGIIQGHLCEAEVVCKRIPFRGTNGEIEYGDIVIPPSVCSALLAASSIMKEGERRHISYIGVSGASVENFGDFGSHYSCYLEVAGSSFTANFLEDSGDYGDGDTVYETVDALLLELKGDDK